MAIQIGLKRATVDGELPHWNSQRHPSPFINVLYVIEQSTAGQASSGTQGQPMKVVTWNCNGALRKKHAAIDQLGADLLIVQECEDPERSTVAYREWAGEYLWHGENKNKGIGIFVRSKVSVEQLDWDDDGLQLFLPCRVDDKFVLLAVWTKYANSPNFRYIGQLWKYLQLHNELPQHWWARVMG